MSIGFNNYRLTKSDFSCYKIPEHSLESFEISLTKIIKASSITQQVLSKAMKISNTTIHNYLIGIKNLAMRTRTNFNIGDIKKIKNHCGYIVSLDSSLSDNLNEVKSILEVCRKETCMKDMDKIIMLVDEIIGFV